MITHIGTQVIKTQRLTLRLFRAEDAGAVYRNWASDAEVTRYLTWRAHENEEITRGVLATWVSDYALDDNYQWAIVPNGAEEPVGCIAVVSKNDAVASAQIGYALGRAWWRRGYMSEALRAVIDYLFSKVGVNRIEARHDPENSNSGKVMQKCGMTREGILRQADRNNQGIVDACLYSILREDWEVEAEIRRYLALPCEFHGFIDVPELTDGRIRLVCVEKIPAIPEKKYVPVYDFIICRGSEKVGEICLRVGYAGFGPNEGSLYYGGQIGYGVNEDCRGNGYAGAACRLIAPVAKAHGMTKLLITNNVENTASRRVCEKLGLRHVRQARLPEWTDLYKSGQRFLNIYEMNLE